ncbi:MAG: transcription termination factor Rho [Actinobacteria bacterium]|nr:transcription termination factor Rho [Actinomycetota bacterium]
MSGLHRSMLERKERDELSQIAEQLGKKPPSRARKAEIVDLILQLAGVDEAAGQETLSQTTEPTEPIEPTQPSEAAEPSGAAEAAVPGDAVEPERREAAERAARTAGAGSAPAPGTASPRGGEVASPGGAENDPSTDPGPRSGGHDGGGAAVAPEAAPAAGRDARRPGGTRDGGDRPGRPDRADGGPGDRGDRSGPGRDGGRAGAAGGARRRGPAGAPAAPAPKGGGPNAPSSQQSPSQGARAGEGTRSPAQAGSVQANQAAQEVAGDDGRGDDDGRFDDGEGGARRRRRRGRDRERGPEGQQQPAPPADDTPVDVDGVLDLRDEGYGFLRLHGYLPSRDDAYVSVKQVRQLGLRKGDRITGKSRPAGRNEKNPALLQIDAVNGKDPEAARERPRFEDLTPLFPDSPLRLERRDEPGNMTARVVDLISPIGKGQRGLIVSPPKAGKTTIMKEIARSIERNNPDVELIVLLVDERPEEVTDFRRWLDRGEVAASTFDRPSDEHTVVAELVIERAKRMVEDGKDVCIILDGITRLARAYNLAAPATGRIMSGGIDAGALYPPKKFFGAARNVEEGGSLTILATALVETGSRMDEHIFEEFKGTGNAELKLDRRLAERRIFPAIDVDASSTRHEELLFDRRQLQQVWKLRRVLSALKADEGTSGAAGLELLLDRMRSFRSNDEFLAEIAKSPAG